MKKPTVSELNKILNGKPKKIIVSKDGSIGCDKRKKCKTKVTIHSLKKFCKEEVK